MREIILIRHGESQYNAYLTDNLDSELTPKGIEQARATGRFLREHFGHITNFFGITSPYWRCLETANIIQQETGMEFQVHDGPREVMMRYERVQIPCRRELYPKFMWNENIKDWTFFQETAEEFVARKEAFVRSVRDHEKLLIVSHGTSVNTMYELSLGMKHRPNTSHYVRNASISYIRGNDGIWFDKVVYDTADALQP